MAGYPFKNVLIERAKFWFKCLRIWLLTECNWKCFLREFSKIRLVFHRCISITEQNNKRKKNKDWLRWVWKIIDQINNKISFFLNLLPWSMLGSSSSSCHLTNGHANSVPPSVGKITKSQRKSWSGRPGKNIDTLWLMGKVSVSFLLFIVSRTSSFSSGSSV